MNKVILMGRLTRDPDVRYSQGVNQLAVAKYSLAVDRRFKRDGEPTADFFNCTAFGKQAEFAEKYFKQGTKIVITGRIQNDNYTNKEGQKVYSVSVIVEEQEFAESKSVSDTNRSNISSNSYNEPAPAPTGTTDDFMNIPDGLEDGLPFN